MTRAREARDAGEVKSSTDDRLDAIEAVAREILRELRARRRKAGKRAGAVARRVANDVEHAPSELERRRARQILQRKGAA